MARQSLSLSVRVFLQSHMACFTATSSPDAASLFGSCYVVPDSLIDSCLIIDFTLAA